ncbi:MAG: hypothetical protein QMC23_11460 [Rubritalea sp.]|jgi:hypothetical protein|tara:strand:+ start:1110 stop:1466 length:357 start_codon:yes stop_codon:yes gene_type:complete
MIWGGYNRLSAQSAENIAARAQSTADRYAYDIKDIQQKVERLSLSCQAMWELLRDHSELNEKDIEAKILEIDNRDGRVDGKISTQTLACASCGRPTNSRRSMCVICGADIDKKHKFEV